MNRHRESVRVCQRGQRGSKPEQNPKRRPRQELLSDGNPIAVRKALDNDQKKKETKRHREKKRI